MSLSKLLSQGGFGCIYYPGIKCNSKREDNKNVVTKLQKNDESSKNEINIGEIIMNIEDYQLYFLPVIGSCPINLGSINKSLLEQCDIVNKDKDEQKYILMEIPYVKNKSFYTILIDMYSSKKHIIVGLIENYSYLLDSINILL